MLTFKDIQEAYEILKPVVRRTPLERSKTFSQMTKNKRLPKTGESSDDRFV